MFRDATANDAPDVGEEQVRVQVDWTRPAKFKYVALGDSFSAGEGIEEFFEPKNKCHRSKLSYATLVERPGSYGVPVRELAASPTSGVAWGFQACSGAETKDVLQRQLARDRSADPGNQNYLPV